MKPAGWSVNFHLGPWIHPEDAIKAIHAKLNEKRKNRQKTSEEIIVQDLFIASLVNNQPLNKEQIAKIEEASKDKGFKERWARAHATNKPPTWDLFDILILQNWRELHLGPKIPAQLRAAPGLQDWSPQAAASLFEYAGASGVSGEWFTKRRKRLGLPGKNQYQVKDLIPRDGNVRVVQ